MYSLLHAYMFNELQLITESFIILYFKVIICFCRCFWPTHCCPRIILATKGASNRWHVHWLWREQKDVPQTLVKLSGMSESWAKDLEFIERLFDQHEFSRGKVEWLHPFPQFNFSGASGIIDVWGNKFDLFWQPCASMLNSAVKSTCSSQQCPKREDLLTATGINLTEISSQQLMETYIEAAIREWQLPATTQCRKEFAVPPPPNTDAFSDRCASTSPLATCTSHLFVMEYVPSTREHSFLKCHLLYQFRCTTSLPTA